MTKNVNTKSWTFTGSPRASYDSANLNGDTAASGYVRFVSSRYTATGTGNLTIEVERYGGSAGSLSGAITQSDANRSTGKYTAAPINFSFANGEVGIKQYTFNVTTAPTDGPYWVNLHMTVGATQPRHWWDFNSEIEVNDGVNVPTVDTTNVYEVGPTGDYTTIVGAASNVTAPALILIRGGTYANEDTQSDGLGINPRYSGNRADRIIYMAYPSETPVIEADSTITDMTLQVPNNNGFRLRPSRAGNAPLNGLVFKGLTIKSATAGIYAEGSSTYHENIMVEDCTIFDIGGAAGTNPGGVRWDDARNCVVRNCNIHHIYEGNSLHLTEHDNNACIHGYRGCDILIEDNKLGNAAHNIYHKNPFLQDSGQTGYVIRRNLFDPCSTNIRFEDNYVGQENDMRFNRVDIYHNIAPTSTLVEMRMRGSFYSSKDMWIYGNNCIDDLGRIEGFEDVSIYNNLIITTGTTFQWDKPDGIIKPSDNPYNPADPNSWPTPGDAASTSVNEIGTVGYFDNNIYWPSLSVNWAWEGSNALLVSSLTNWRTTTDGYIMPTAIAGAASSITDPALDVNNRATNTLPSGRFGLDIGVPDSVVVGGTT